MSRIDFTKRAEKRLVSLPPKHSRQVAAKIRELGENPHPPDSGKLKGYPFYRVDVGEYRVIYEEDRDTVVILLIGKRNDSEVYKELKRVFG